MASSKEYLDFILEQLSELEDVSWRAMMGEYIIYYGGKVVGGIYDDRFLVKPVKAAKDLMPDADMEIPYEGAKEMILVDDLEDKDFLKKLLEAMYQELPAPKKKKIINHLPFNPLKDPDQMKQLQEDDAGIIFLCDPREGHHEGSSGQ